jgi:hypothetical protein
MAEVTLARLRKLLGVSRWTLRRRLHARGASYRGHSITFDELDRVWPELARIVDGFTRRACTWCGGQLVVSCSCCHRDIPQK